MFGIVHGRSGWPGRVSRGGGPERSRPKRRRKLVAIRYARMPAGHGTGKESRDQPHARGGLPAVVPERRPRRRGRRARPRPRLHGDPPLGLRDLGADAAGDGRRDQGHRRRQRLLPALHPAQLLRGGGQARRGLRQGDGGRHPPPAREGRRRQRWSRPPSCPSRWSSAPPPRRSSAARSPSGSTPTATCRC